MNDVTQTVVWRSKNTFLFPRLKKIVQIKQLLDVFLFGITTLPQS